MNFRMTILRQSNFDLIGYSVKFAAFSYVNIRLGLRFYECFILVFFNEQGKIME